MLYILHITILFLFFSTKCHRAKNTTQFCCITCYRQNKIVYVFKSMSMQYKKMYQSRAYLNDVLL